MEVWEEIRDLWLEVREFKWKCHNIPTWAQGKLTTLVRLYKQQHPQAYVNTSACKLAQTITTIGRSLEGRGLIEGTLIIKR